MKKFVLIFLAIGLIIPLFAVPTSAASYELSAPRVLNYTSGINPPSNWKLGSIYLFNSDDRSLSVSYPGIGKSGFGYYENYNAYLNNDPVFFFGTRVLPQEVGRNIEMQSYDRNIGTLFYGATGDVQLQLRFASFVYERLLLPSDGQVLKVSFEFEAPLILVPSEVVSFLDTDYMCFLCDTSGRAGYNDRYSLPKVFPSTATVVRDENTFKYTFYFQLTYKSLLPLVDSDNVCLAVRLPFYFPPNFGYDNGIRILTNADFPNEYEIITVGGYSQELADIQSSVDSLKTDLFDFYTDQSSSDLAFVSRGEIINTQVTNAIGEYNEALKPLDSVRDQYTAPPMQSLVGDKLQDFQTEDVKQFFSVPWVVSALTLVFAFSIIRLILYGTKEG